MNQADNSNLREIRLFVSAVLKQQSALLGSRLVVFLFLLESSIGDRNCAATARYLSVTLAKQLLFSFFLGDVRVPLIIRLTSVLALITGLAPFDCFVTQNIMEKKKKLINASTSKLMSIRRADNITLRGAACDIIR